MDLGVGCCLLLPIFLTCRPLSVVVVSLLLSLLLLLQLPCVRPPASHGREISSDTHQLFLTARGVCCQQQLGFYLTADGAELTPELLDAAGLDQETVDTVIETLEEDTADAEGMLVG